MKNKNRYFFVFLLIIIVICSTACMNSPEAKPQLKPKPKIGLILADTKSTRNQFLLTKMKDEISNQKFKLITGDSELDPQKQEAQIKKMIEEKAQIVILQPLNLEVTKDHISMLIEKNIKIIVIDFLPKDVLVDAFIAPDYLRAGELQAQYLINQNKIINPLIIKGDVTHVISEKILEGNLKILENNSFIHNLTAREVNNNFESRAYEILLNEYNQYTPNALIAHSEEVTQGLIKYIKEAKIENQIILVSLDIKEDLLEDIHKGYLVVVDTMPNLLVQVIVDSIKSLLENETWNYDLQVNNDTGLIPAKFTAVRMIGQDNIGLLGERFPTLEKKKSESKTEEQQTKNKNTQKQTKLKIKLKDGQQYEVTIPGEIEQMEIEPQ